MDDKSEREIFVGYGGVPSSYYLFDPQTKRCSLSRNVVFHELSTSNGNTSSEETLISQFLRSKLLKVQKL